MTVIGKMPRPPGLRDPSPTPSPHAWGEGFLFHQMEGGQDI